jgi:hypothetical protein
MSDALRKLELALEPVHPALVLDIEAGKLEVNARVYQGDEPFDVIESVDVTVNVARTLISRSARLCIDGDEASLEAFNATLTALEGGVVVKPYTDAPTCTIDDVTDFIRAEMQLTETVLVQIGEARWRVEA